MLHDGIHEQLFEFAHERQGPLSLHTAALAIPSHMYDPFQPAVYTVHIRGETFRLSESQINFDAPNFFTRAFSSDWSEGDARAVEILDRNPGLFRNYIVDWLAAYELPWNSISQDTTLLANLLSDARFYGLSALETRLSPDQAAESYKTSFDWDYQQVTTLPGGVHEYEVILRHVPIRMELLPMQSVPGSDTLRITVTLPSELVDELLEKHEQGDSRYPPTRSEVALPVKIQYEQSADSHSAISTPFILSDFDTTWRGNLQDLHHAYREIVGLGNRTAIETESLRSLVQLLERHVIVDDNTVETFPKMTYECLWEWHATEMRMRLRFENDPPASLAATSWYAVGVHQLVMCSDAHATHHRFQAEDALGAQRQAVNAIAA